MHQKKVGVILVIAMALVLTAPASATILVPGGAVVPASFSGAPGTLLASITSPFVSVLGAGDFSGTTTEAVYRDSVTNTLDFLYQFSNDATSSEPIEGSSDGSYAGFTTDVFSELGGPAFGPFSALGTAGALEATRTVNGDGVSFDFPVPGAVLPGETSAIRMIKTNATAFQPGTVSFIDQGTATLTDFFAPAPVPEPGSLILVGGMGLLGLGWRRRRA